MILPRSGRRLAVRAAFALLLYTQPRTPLCRCAAFPLKGKQGMVPLFPRSIGDGKSAKHRFPLRPLEGERATKWRGGVVRQEPQMILPPRQAAVWRSGLPLCFISTCSLVHPFAAARHFPSRGNKRLCRYPLRPEMARTENAAEPCAPLRGRGPRSGAGVYYAEDFNEQPSSKYS